MVSKLLDGAAWRGVALDGISISIIKSVRVPGTWYSAVSMVSIV